VDQAAGILGRDRGDLTEAGRQYCILLSQFIKQEQEKQFGSGREIIIMGGTQQVGSSSNCSNSSSCCSSSSSSSS